MGDDGANNPGLGAGRAAVGVGGVGKDTGADFGAGGFGAGVGMGAEDTEGGAVRNPMTQFLSR